VKKAKQAGFDLTYKILFPHLVTNSIATDELLRLDIADYIYYIPTKEVFEQLQAQAEAKRIKNALDAHAAINSGRFDDADEFLQNNKTSRDPAIPKMIERISQIKDIISLAKAGKYDEANAKIAELEQVGKYKGAVAILQNQIEKAKATGKWQDYVPQPPLNPVMVLDLLNAGKLKEAEEALKSGNFVDPGMNKKILSRIQEIRLMEKLAREGKCDEAMRMATEMKQGGGAMYGGIATIMIEKIQKTKETGKWPE
jgi:soluble cytochrome b562